MADVTTDYGGPPPTIDADAAGYWAGRDSTDTETPGPCRLVPGERPDRVLIAASVAASGWPVLALWPGTKKPTHRGSEAGNHADHWLTSPAAVARCADEHDDREPPEGARRGCPSYAAMTGQPSRRLDGLALVALDLDGDPDGLAALLAEAGPEAVEWAAETLRVQRTADRAHLWGTVPADECPPTGHLTPSLEWRGSTGYAALPGTRHASGALYEVTGGRYEFTDGGQPDGALYVGLTEPDEADPTGLAAWVHPLPVPGSLLAAVRRRFAAARGGDDVPTGLTTAEVRGRLDARPAAGAFKPALDATRPRTDGPAFARLLDALRDAGRFARVRGDGRVLAHCPGPEHRNGDRSPSLSVSGVAGRVLVHCFTGCETTDVLAALGLRLADLYDDHENGDDAVTLHAVGGDDDATPDPATESEPDPLARARARFHLYDRDALDALPEPVELLSGILPARGALVVFTGSRGLGKSLLTQSLSGAVSCGLDHWHDPAHVVSEHGPVLYVAREGFHGVPRRVRAWETHHGRRLDAVTWLPSPVDLKRPADARDLALIAADLGAVAVVTDSARATGAGKEDTEDMGAFVSGLEAVAKFSGALVLTLHNTGWDDSRGRGSTLLPDAADTVLHLDGKPDPGSVRTLKHHKHRDGDMIDALRFRFLKVEGTDSGVLVPTDAPAVVTARREDNRQTVEAARLSLLMARVCEVLAPSRHDPSRAMSGRKVEATLRAAGHRHTSADVRAALAGLEADEHVTGSPHRLVRPFYVVTPDPAEVPE